MLWSCFKKTDACVGSWEWGSLLGFGNRVTKLSIISRPRHAFLLNYSHSNSSFCFSSVLSCHIKKYISFYISLLWLKEYLFLLCWKVNSFFLSLYISLSLLAFVSHHTQRFSVMPSSTDFNLRIYTSTHAHVLSWGHVAASWNSPLADLVSQITR